MLTSFSKLNYLTILMFLGPYIKIWNSKCNSLNCSWKSSESLWVVKHLKMCEFQRSIMFWAFLWLFIRVWCAPHEPNVVWPNFVKLHSAKLHLDFWRLFSFVFRGKVVVHKKIPNTAAPIKNDKCKRMNAEPS